MDLGFFKRHPYLTGGVIVVGGVVFFIFFTAGSSGGVTVQQTGQDPNSLALQIAQMQQGTASTNIAAQLEAKRIESATAIELGSMSFDLEALKVAAQQMIGLGAIDSQNKVTAAQLEQYRIGSAAALEQSRMNFQLQDTIAARNAALQFSQIASDNDKAAWQYQLNYQNNANQAQLTQQLLERLKAA